MKRRDALLQTLATNPLAPYVIRSIDVGSEPLYDCSCHISFFVSFVSSFSADSEFDFRPQGSSPRRSLLSKSSAYSIPLCRALTIDLASLWAMYSKSSDTTCRYVKNHTSTYGTKVAISEMEYGYTVQGNSSAVFNAIDVVHASKPLFHSFVANPPCTSGFLPFSSGPSRHAENLINGNSTCLQTSCHSSTNLRSLGRVIRV